MSGQESQSLKGEFKKSLLHNAQTFLNKQIIAFSVPKIKTFDKWYPYSKRFSSSQKKILLDRV